MTGTVVRRSLAAATVLALPLALAACAGGPPTVSPSGRDGLTVPTPSPDPADFVAGVDNPWFPLAPGTVRTYRVTGAGEARTETVTVTDRSRVVAGVRCVVVHDVTRSAAGKPLTGTWEWFAQDTGGNVWLFGEHTTAARGAGPAPGDSGEAGSWEAGVDGAQAGLMMEATPRLGDGYEQEHLAGVAEDRAEILSLSAVRDVPFGAFHHLVQTEDTTPLVPSLVRRSYYARGVGLVAEETVAGGSEVVELTGLARG